MSACWHDVLAEWATGRISTAHPPSCYRDAMAKAPLDLRLYSSVEDDLQRALAAAVQRDNLPSAEKVRTPAGRRIPASAVPADSSRGTPVALIVLTAAVVLVFGALGVRRSRRRPTG